MPDYTLYEKEEYPSRFNGDHKHTFSLRVGRATAQRANHWHVQEDLAPLLESLGMSLCESFLEDDNYDYGLGRDRDQTHFPATLAQVCLIARKERVSSTLARIRDVSPSEPISREPLRIYTGILGQIGDIVMFTPTVRRLKELFPNSTITFAVHRRYREAGELVAGLPYVDRMFVTECYFERLAPRLRELWGRGWPLDLRGDDEIAEQKKHDLVFETRPRSRRMPWWNYAHQVEECAHMVGVPGPIARQTEVAIPPDVVIPSATHGKIVLHNDPSIDPTKAWPWESVRQLVSRAGPQDVVLIGQPGPKVDGVIDCRGKTTLTQAAAIIAASRCFIGIDSGPMWIAGSLQVPTVGLYGTSYRAAYGAIQPQNPRATYLQVEGTLDRIQPEQVWEQVAKRIS